LIPAKRFHAAFDPRETTSCGLAPRQTFSNGVHLQRER
jgi:hypothetical protein